MKIKALTFIELIMTIAISGFIITLFVWFYVQIQSMITEQLNDFDENLEIALFQTDFHRDFVSADNIGQSGNIISFTNHEKNIISYNFCKEFITKSTYDKIDTFFVTTHEITVSEDRELNLINRISFVIVLNDLNIPVNMKKKYPKAILFNHENTKF